jgi:hypothetical protein
MSEKKYIIKIYISHDFSSMQQSHYFKEITEKSYYTETKAKNATKFTKERAIKEVKKIENVYKINPGNGNLLKIEILNADTLQIVNFDTIEDDTVTSRFDLIDFD